MTADAENGADDLAERIFHRLYKIPANNPSMMSLYPTTVGDILSRELLRLLAKEAAEEATK